MTPLRILTTLAALALGTALSGAALARENHALLIGASTYPNLDERFWLKGPANDVDLVHRYLMANTAAPFDPANITLLADGLDGGRAPTLAEIRAEMARLTDTVGPDDFVYLHFSGHGSQAPALDPSTETDGLDELFLPVDIGPWQDGIGTVQNALSDDEIGQMLDALRATGADVWVVFDSCHSGTATRAAPLDERVTLRKLPPDALGVPDAAIAAAEAEAGAARALASDPREPAEPPVMIPGTGETGSLVAFFAAQTDETTPEKNMPKGSPDRRLQGVFTYTLFQTLAEHPGVTYRQLAQEVLRRYTTGNLARSTPLFEGDMDRPVFGTDAGDRIAQWPATVTDNGLRVAAGTLHGIVPGMELSVMASPADPDTAALGQVTVTGADTFTTTTDAAMTIPRGAYLRKTEDIIDFSLTVALPARRGEAARALVRAAEIIQTQGMAGPRLRFVAAGAEADLRLAVFADSPRPDAIWFLPASGVVGDGDLERLPSVSTAEKSDFQLADVISDNLQRMARALNLLKIGATAGSGALKVKASLLTSRLDPATDEIVEGSRQQLTSVNVPRLVPGDVIGMRLENTTDGPVDYNILYVGSDYSISFMDRGRLLPGSTLDEDFVLITDEAFGRDRMVVVLTPALPGADVEDLSFLEQSAIERMRAANTTPRSDVASMLEFAGFGETTRAAVSLKSRKAPDAPAPMFLQFEFDTVPEG
ncbi:caspase family protein [Oceaniglobus indicus]|uniref:caspase family protein n=1 Tax=Oceaniglobus indicus TaxID=2047749 RepID=UPI000C187BEA|nr:caspase family protein [Oceaniglobus indicus]